MLLNQFEHKLKVLVHEIVMALDTVSIEVKRRFRFNNSNKTESTLQRKC